MKNKLLLTILALLSSTLAVVYASENSVITRIDVIYVDEIVEDGDEGVGATIEFATIFDQTEYSYQTFGLEFGVITSEVEESGDTDEFGFTEAELDTTLIPLFANYTVGSYLGDSGFFIEGGAGIGLVYVDFDINVNGSNGSDDDVVLGVQFLGRFGYEFTETACLSFGVRYMIADEPDFFGVEIPDTLNSVAFDVGLSFVF